MMGDKKQWKQPVATKLDGESLNLLYETTNIWNSEPQNNEQEISNDEVWNRFALTISD